jgi:hypothetical protein
MMAVAVAWNQLEHAIRWFLQFRTYLRPGECDALKGRNLVRPQPVGGRQYQMWGLLLHREEDHLPSKTFLTDEAVILDSDPWLNSFLETLKASRGEDESLWRASPEDNIAMFNAISEQLNLTALQPTRYALRHGGASEDLLAKRRTLMEVKRRGRWVHDASLRRYGKETRLLSELSKIPVGTLAYGKLAMERLPDILLGRFRPDMPK